MLIVKVKICGLTNYEDAAAAINMGADLLGFNFYPKSPRYITPEKAAEIIRKLPAFTDIVGVFVNEPIEKIHETREMCHLDWVQLHGDEDPEFCNQFFGFCCRFGMFDFIQCLGKRIGASPNAYP